MKKQTVVKSVTALLFLAGCATTPKQTATVEVKPSEAQKIYFEGVSIVTQAKASGEKCTYSVNTVKDTSWKTLVRHASACARAESWKTVEVIAEEMAKSEINSPWSPYFHSLAAEKSGDFPRAMWMIDLAMKKASGAALFHYQKGRVFWQLGSNKDAINEITTATQLDAKLAMAHVFLGQAHHRQLNYEKAISHYQSALNIESGNPVCLQGLADVHLAQGKPQKAVELLEPAVSRQTSNLDLRVRLAQAFEGVEKDEQALEQYKAIRQMGKTSTLGFDLNDKIKTLEAKVTTLKNAQNQAKLDDKAKPAPARKPSSVKGGGK